MKHGLLFIGLLLSGSITQAGDAADFSYLSLPAGSSFKSTADFHIPANVSIFKVTPSDPSKWAHCSAEVPVHTKNRVLKAGKEIFSNGGRQIGAYWAFDFYPSNSTSLVLSLICPTDITIRELNENYIGDFEIVPAASEEIP